MKKFIKSLKFIFTFFTLVVFLFTISYLNESNTSADLTTSSEKSISISLKKDNSYKSRAFIDPETGNFIAPDINELEQIPESSIDFGVQEELVVEDAPGGGEMVVLPNGFLNLMSVKIDDGKLNAECHRNQN